MILSLKLRHVYFSFIQKLIALLTLLVTKTIIMQFWCPSRFKIYKKIIIVYFVAQSTISNCLGVGGRVCHDIKKSKPRRGPMVSSCTLVLSTRINRKKLFFSFVTYPLFILKKNFFAPFFGHFCQAWGILQKTYFWN